MVSLFDDDAIDKLIAEPDGRRRLRSMPELSPELAARLLAFQLDYRQARRDRTLDAPVRVAPLEDVTRHALALASSPAASALWLRLAEQPPILAERATAIVGAADATAAESTLYLLVLDPLDPYRVGATARQRIAVAALHSVDAGVRGLAAEFLAGHAPGELLAEFDWLIVAADERTRAVTWVTAFQLARADAHEQALAIVMDANLPVATRRSALVALGTHLPTSDVIDVLRYALVQPDPRLAEDAANLLHDLHRHPEVAEAAQRSPHAAAREVAAYLMDPYRGSPAAGGSRPGDPTRGGDIFEEMLRRLDQAQTPGELATPGAIGHTSAPQESKAPSDQTE
jgi:hypothetical protein